MNTTTKKIALTTLTASLIALSLTTATFANDHEGVENEERPDFSEVVEREIVNLSNGAQITITTDDEEALEHILERASNHQDRGGNEDVEHNVEVLDDGVRITVTTDDADLVSRIQERAEEGPKGPGHGPGEGQGHGPNGDGGCKQGPGGQERPAPQQEA